MARSDKTKTTNSSQKAKASASRPKPVPQKRVKKVVPQESPVLDSNSDLSSDSDSTDSGQGEQAPPTATPLAAVTPERSMQGVQSQARAPIEEDPEKVRLREALEEANRRAEAEAEARRRAEAQLVAVAPPPAVKIWVYPGKKGKNWKRSSVKDALGLGKGSNPKVTFTRTKLYNWIQAAARRAVFQCHLATVEKGRIEWGQQTWKTCSQKQRKLLMKEFRDYIKSYEELRRVFYYPLVGPTAGVCKFDKEWIMTMLVQNVLRNEKEQEERPVEYLEQVLTFENEAKKTGADQREPLIGLPRTIVKPDGTPVQDQLQEEVNQGMHHDVDDDSGAEVEQEGEQEGGEEHE